MTIEEVRELAHNVEACNPNCNAMAWRELFLALLDVFEEGHLLAMLTCCEQVLQADEAFCKAYITAGKLIDEMR